MQLLLINYYLFLTVTYFFGMIHIYFLSVYEFTCVLMLSWYK